MLEYVNQGNAQIKVFGVGGGGSNAVDCMINDGGIGLEGITFICSNTDAQALQKSNAPIKIQLGMSITSGLGAGANPEIGERSAIEDQERIREVLDGADMVFITAGMGGGTGTGAAPVVAQIAKSLDILTVAVVTKPLKIEGKHRMASAERGIQELRKHVDSLIEIPNQRLLGQAEGMGLNQTFAFANKVLIDAVRGITEIINGNGVINVDFADVKTIMSNQGSPSALMGTGVGRGEKRALSAAAAAISSPLLNHDISGASAVLMNFTGGTTMSLEEIHDAADTITQKISGDPQVILGMVVDETGFDDECMKVTVIATGFPELPNEDYFDGHPARNASPYDRRGARSSLPVRQRSDQSSPPFEGRSYKTTSLSTNPPMLNDASSSSSSDEHPQWQADAPNIVNEAKQSNHEYQANQAQYRNQPSNHSGAYRNQSQSQNDVAKRNAYQGYEDSMRVHSAPPSSEAYGGGVRYPERNYQARSRGQGYPQQRGRSASRSYDTRATGHNHAHNPNAHPSSPHNHQVERSEYRQSKSNQAAESDVRPAPSNPTPSRANGPRERAKALSSLMPVAPMGRPEDDWGNQPRKTQEQVSHDHNRSEGGNTQDYDSVGSNPNSLRFYRN